MSDADSFEDRRELIQRYKTLLKDVVDRRPSGIRLKIAESIGRNKSFVSQITSPNYKTPLPEKYVDPILDAIHLTQKERDQFLHIYRRAHPRARTRSTEPVHEEMRVLKVELPKLESRRLENRVDQMIAQFARNLNDIARGR